MTDTDSRQWILRQIEAGHSPDVLLQKMLESGWAEDQALDALESTLQARVAELRPAPLPAPNLSESPTMIAIDGRTIPVLLHLREPPLTVFEQFLSYEECDALIEAARPRLARSTVLADETGDNELHAGRVSQGMFFARSETPLIHQIEERIAQLVNWPLDHGETLQILRYGPGGKYDPHYDYFDPALPGSREALRVAGNRVGTLIMFLQSPERGGSTLFPDVGLEVFAQRGNAVFFAYDRPHPSTRSLHGGAPVIAGEKWIATKWLRERPFTQESS